MTRVAKLFKNGASQAVRLPAEYRFEGDEVYVSRDERTGDVTLSSRPGAKSWSQFFDMIEGIEDRDGFMADRPMNRPARDAGVFDDEA